MSPPLIPHTLSSLPTPLAGGGRWHSGIVGNFSAAEQVVHFFEICCKLSQDFLKEHAEEKASVVQRDTIDCAVGLTTVKDAEGWSSLLQDQWMMSEIYEETTAGVVEENIRMKYFPLLTHLRHEFSIMMIEKEK